MGSHTQKPSARMIDLAAAVQLHTARTGSPPSWRELADELDLSLIRVRDLAVAAKKRGLITFEPGVPRSFKVVDPAPLRRPVPRQKKTAPTR